ncbi:Transglutaminase-like superfamily protein [Flavobacterium swingsii]|uniref:Transglutaminase-like superfamily protein n=1 Tax=Flavobacterium swingsii TaxID=498292 RepID=A0A1I0YRD4_9FLAO|nr:transglutaminase domain-containing protein [Flavobacterium swingsii]SFB15761.1 Transglutaminase-like superfamily protein [Flavobacterium swingsii]
MSKLITFKFSIILVLISTFSYSKDVFSSSTIEIFQEYKNSDVVDRILNPKKKSIPKKKSTISVKKTIPVVVKPDKFYILDTYARNTPKEYEKDIKTLTQYLIAPAKTDLEKTRLIFVWITKNINYDDYAYNTGKYKAYSDANILKYRKGVCDDFSSLFKSMCVEAGLEAEKVTGYAKGYGYKIGDKFKKVDHAWNAVKIEKKWKLFDVTWSEGPAITRKGKLVSVKKFDSYWFDVNPKEFIFSHFPEEEKWQKTGKLITLEKYETMPWLMSDFFKIGYDSNKIFEEAIDNNFTKFVPTYSTSDPSLKFINLPYTKNLIKTDTLNFQIKSLYAHEIVLIDNNKWLKFTKKDSVYSIKHKPKGKKIQICVKRYRKGGYETVAVYSMVSRI